MIMKRTITKETREKMRQTALANYKSGKRTAVYKGQKRPDHSLVLKQLYQDGKREPVVMLNENNPSWKGDKASYSALHKWLRNHKQKTGQCDSCGTTQSKRTEYANISKQYKRDITDYHELCTSCHRLFDYGKLEVFYYD